MLNKKIGWRFDNSYSDLPERLFSRLNPTPVKSPKLVILNKSLSKEIGLNFSDIDDEELALIFSGNKLPEGSDSIAQAYAGHQFGHFSILGDGRALIIGEHITQNKNRFDIQFKGSGKTPYSRNADGRAALGPMLREYIVSEAMNYLRIPTTRSLAVVETGENVIREKNLKGAILTRVASSHIRVGTFQFALISKEKKNLKTLLNYTIERHYPYIKKLKSPVIELLKTVIEKQINLVCEWMRVGFIHGVMNTDNMTISGETIDYGPCAFMDKYDPSTVFSSIDQYGRYAYFNQPSITKWNLERFAESLLPLIDSDVKKSVEIASEVLKEFQSKYKACWYKMMKKKLGLKGEDSNDKELIVDLLSWMHQNKVDYTNTFCHLMNKLNKKNEIYNDQKFILWKKKWKKRRLLNKNSIESSLNLMSESNPLVIPRNHLVEEALNDAVEKNDLKKVNTLLEAIKDPYKETSLTSIYQSEPDTKKEKYQTFCGT